MINRFMKKYEPFKIIFPKIIFVSTLIIIAFSPFNFSYAGNIHGVIKKNNTLYSFENFVIANSDDQFSVNYKANEKEEIKIVYENPNKEKKFFSNIKLKKNEVFIFPERSKYITFSDNGLHTITISSVKSSKKINIYISDDINNELFIKNQVKQEERNSLKDISKFDLVQTNRSASKYNFKPIKGGFSQRSGSKIYMDFARSVVLVRGQDGFGAGVVIGEGKILTNYHVIENNRNFGITKKPLNITDENIQSATTHPVKVIYVNKKYDLALLGYDNNVVQIPAVGINYNAPINIGDKVHAIGHPLGEYWTYTQGIISQVRTNYKICLYEQCNDDDLLKADVIQTQTPINPGNSGGPLINQNSELVGINTFSRVDSKSLNFAVSISSINKFLNGENYKHTYIQKKDKNKSKKEEKTEYKFKPNHECTLLNEKKLDLKRSQYFDCNENNIIDLIAIDLNKNNKVDIYLYDDDENGYTDYHEQIIFVDNEYKKIRTYWSNTKNNKKLETRIDNNGNGEFDTVFHF